MLKRFPLPGLLRSIQKDSYSTGFQYQHDRSIPSSLKASDFLVYFPSSPLKTFS